MDKALYTSNAECNGALPDLASVPPVNTPLVDYKQATNEQLLAAARSSDGRAFVELSGRYATLIRTKVFRIVRNREDAEDVVQETLFKAYVHLKDFRGTCSFSSWLTTIAINSALMLLRRRRVRPEVSLDQPKNDDPRRELWEVADPSPNPEQAYAKRQALDHLSRAITHLPSLYRSVISQYYDHQQSIRSVADTVGISTAAAKTRLLRARHFIRSTLDKSEPPQRAEGVGQPRCASTCAVRID